MSAQTTPNLFQQCIGEGALAEAWAKVFSNGGCAGVDGVTLQDFRAEALSNLARLREALLAGTYRPQPLLGVDIPKDNGRLRRLAIPSVRDRVIQTAVAQRLTALLDPSFDEASFAYRTGRSVRMATARIVDCRNLGLAWVVDADIRDYFDTIHHPSLLWALRRQLPDGSLTALLAQWLAAPLQVDGALSPRRRGVPQGSPISPLLANLYLHPLDASLGAAGFSLVRYADDFLVLCRSKAEAEVALALVRARLDDLSLALNEEKTRVTHFEAGFDFLGVHFQGSRVRALDPAAAPWLEPRPAALAAPAPSLAAAVEGRPVGVVVATATKNAPGLPVFEGDAPLGQEPAMEEPEIDDPESVRYEPRDGLNLPRSLYVTSQGVRLTKQGNQLWVSRAQDCIARAPLGLLDMIVVHGNATVSTAIIRHCQEQGLGLVFADQGGMHTAALDTGRFASLALLKAQAGHDGDVGFGLEFARACVEGKLHNCRVVLRRFARRESPERVERAISILGRSLRRLARVASLEALRGVEGRAARAYFAAVAALIPADWGFEGRNRQPPRDPLNALFSYGYAVLSHVVLRAVVLARLHPAFGHLHVSAGARPSLVCDLMEEFRPLVVDAVVLTLARGKPLRPERDFTPGGEGGCRIEPAAKQAFIARLEAKLGAEARHESGHAPLHRLIRAQAERYASALRLGAACQPYRPYLA